MKNNVEVKNISFSYGKTEILKDLSLDIREGEFMVLLGPSGCGKTTLLNCIAGLLDLTDGQIWIEDDNVTWKEPKDRHIGMVFQSYALYPSMTVEKNLSFGLRMINTPKNIINEKIDTGPVIMEKSDIFPSICKIPKDFDDHEHKHLNEFYREILTDLKKGKKFDLKHQQYLEPPSHIYLYLQKY